MKLKEEWADHIHHRLVEAREKLKAQERELFEEALMIGNHRLAARAMGISKRTLYYQMRRYGITRSYKGQWSDPDNTQAKSGENT